MRSGAVNLLLVHVVPLSAPCRISSVVQASVCPNLVGLTRLVSLTSCTTRTEDLNPLRVLTCYCKHSINTLRLRLSASLNVSLYYDLATTTSGWIGHPKAVLWCKEWYIALKGGGLSCVVPYRETMAIFMSLPTSDPETTLGDSRDF